MYYQYTVQQPVASDASDARAKVLYVLYARAQHTVQCQYYYLVVRLSTTVFVPVRSVQLYSAVHAMLQHVLLLYLLRSSYLSQLWNRDTGTVPSTYRYYVGRKVLVLSIVHVPGVQYCTVVEYAVLDLVLL